MNELSGPMAGVTGASRGIGRGCALELGAAGATVYLTGRSVKDTDSHWPVTVIATANEIVPSGGRPSAVICDHRDTTLK